jgi:hypothetical protein
MRECFCALLSCFLAMFWNEDTLLAAVHVLVCTLDLRDNIVCGFLLNAENMDDFHKLTFQQGALEPCEALFAGAICSGWIRLYLSYKF